MSSPDTKTRSATTARRNPVIRGEDSALIVPERGVYVVADGMGGHNSGEIASQISVGEENSLAIRVYGESAGIEWHQMKPNTLVVKAGGVAQTVHGR